MRVQPGHTTRSVRETCVAYFLPNSTISASLNVHIVPRRAPGRVDTDKPLAPMTWAQRLKQVFQIDIETCLDCGGRLQVIAGIEDPPLIAKILAHVQRREILPASTARGPPVVAQT